MWTETKRVVPPAKASTKSAPLMSALVARCIVGRVDRGGSGASRGGGGGAPAGARRRGAGGAGPGSVPPRGSVPRALRGGNVLRARAAGGKRTRRAASSTPPWGRWEVLLQLLGLELAEKRVQVLEAVRLGAAADGAGIPGPVRRRPLCGRRVDGRRTLRRRTTLRGAVPPDLGRGPGGRFVLVNISMPAVARKPGPASGPGCQR